MARSTYLGKEAIQEHISSTGSYDGASSGLASDNVIDAIDEVKSLIKSTAGEISFVAVDGNLTETDTNVQQAVETLDGAVRTLGQFQKGRVKLAQDTIYYVDVTNGLDTNDGLTSEGAFQTIQKAFDVIQNDIDANGYKLTIQLLDGDYTSEGVLHLPTIVSPASITCGVSLQTSIDLQLKIIGSSNTLVRGLEIDQSGYNYAISNIKLVGNGGIGISLARNAYASLSELSFEGSFSKGVEITEASTSTFRGIWSSSGSYNNFIELQKSSRVEGDGFIPGYTSTYSATRTLAVYESTFHSLVISFSLNPSASLGNLDIRNSFVALGAQSTYFGTLNILSSYYGSFNGEPLNKYLYSTYTTPTNYNPVDVNSVSSHFEAIDVVLENTYTPPQPLTVNEETITANKSLESRDSVYQHILSNTASLEVSLPSSPVNGTHFIIKNDDAGSESITVTGGPVTAVLAPGRMYEVVYGSTKWMVI